QKLILCFSDFSKQPLINRVKPILSQSPGTIPVVLYFKKEKKRFGADKSLWVTVNDALIKNLKGILGQDKVKMR
ncbi:MAG: hypothetical protein PHN26_07065, partial [Eubacteriaceae bacterium]|nr:hypothetical protein [Eubacteriaceae bacterium]